MGRLGEAMKVHAREKKISLKYRVHKGTDVPIGNKAYPISTDFFGENDFPK